MHSVTTSSEATVRLISDLLAAQLADGGWSAYAKRPADTESTAFASLALILSSKQMPDPGSALSSANRGLSWLDKRHQDDGGWPLNDQVPGSTWTTAPAVLALAVLERNKEQVGNGAAWLVSRKGSGYPLVARFVRWVTGAEDPRKVNELDPSIPGWPWAKGTFSWVEPTALATLALRAAVARGHVADMEATNQRISDAVRWFADRVTPGGGWNYGNKRVLDQDIEPYPDTTAWALLALHGIAGSDALKESLACLHTLMRGNRSALARALAVLAFRGYGEDPDAIAAMLAAQCAGASADTPPADTRTRALALLALAGPRGPFHLS